MVHRQLISSDDKREEVRSVFVGTVIQDNIVQSIQVSFVAAWTWSFDGSCSEQLQI